MNSEQSADVRRRAFVVMLRRAVTVLKLRMHREYSLASPEGGSSTASGLAKDLSFSDAVMAANKLSSCRYDGSSAFCLNFSEVPLKEAESFFLQWKIANPHAVPSDRYHLKCLADAMDAVALGYCYPKDEFIVRVSENFDSWKLCSLS